MIKFSRDLTAEKLLMKVLLFEAPCAKALGSCMLLLV